MPGQWRGFKARSIYSGLLVAKVTITLTDDLAETHVECKCDPPVMELVARVRKHGGDSVTQAEQMAISVVSHILEHGSPQPQNSIVVNPIVNEGLKDYLRVAGRSRN